MWKAWQKFFFSLSRFVVEKEKEQKKNDNCKAFSVHVNTINFTYKTAILNKTAAKFNFIVLPKKERTFNQ